MKVIGIDKKEYTWNIYKYNKQLETCSKYHSRARFLLSKLFPLDYIYEEVVLPGTTNERHKKPLVADFYIPSEKLMIEVQGEQHYQYSYFFHGQRLDFLRSLARDKIKVKWCKINNILLVVLPFNQTDEEWESLIRNRWQNDR